MLPGWHGVMHESIEKELYGTMGRVDAIDRTSSIQGGWRLRLWEVGSVWGRLWGCMWGCMGWLGSSVLQRAAPELLSYTLYCMKHVEEYMDIHMHWFRGEIQRYSLLIFSQAFHTNSNV